MKNLALSIVAIFSLVFSTRVSAQSVAHLNYQEIIQLMPEYQKASNEYEIYKSTLDETLTELENSAIKYQKLIEAESKKPAPNTPKIKLWSRNIEDIQVQYQELQQANQDSLTLKMNELIAPIKKQIEAVVAQIAKEKGYTHVIDISVVYMVYADSAYDITQLVKDKLNLKEKPAVKTGTTGRPATGMQRTGGQR